MRQPPTLPMHAGCAPETRWVTVTNGDNAYDPAFWSELGDAPTHTPLLAFDFYSRYQRFTGNAGTSASSVSVSVMGFLLDHSDRANKTKLSSTHVTVGLNRIKARNLLPTTVCNTSNQCQQLHSAATVATPPQRPVPKVVPPQAAPPHSCPAECPPPSHAWEQHLCCKRA